MFQAPLVPTQLDAKRKADSSYRRGAGGGSQGSSADVAASEDDSAGSVRRCRYEGGIPCGEVMQCGEKLLVQHQTVTAGMDGDDGDAFVEG